MLQLFFPGIERFIVDYLPDSMFTYLIPYIFVIVYLTFKLSADGFNARTISTYLSYLIFGVIFYSLGLFVVLSGFSINNLMMG